LPSLPIACRRRKIPLPAFADAIAPGILVAQAIGRLGNYFNQELYGEPTDRPWGVEIDPAHRVAGYQDSETFHPTFLYESLLNCVIFVVLVWFSRRFVRRIPNGTVFALYVALYNLVRMPMELLRIDTADIYFGQRVNFWVSLILFLVGSIAFLMLWRRRRSAPVTPPASKPAAPATVAGHTPAPRPEAAIAARLRTQRRKKRD